MSCAEAYPEKWAEKQKERKAKQNIVDKEIARVDKLVSVTLRGGNKAVVARLLAIRVEEKVLDEKLDSLKAKIKKLDNEEGALRKKCPHPRKYVKGGFMYTTCDLCFDSW